jgi:hypothetical protein
VEPDDAWLTNGSAAPAVLILGSERDALRFGESPLVTSLKRQMRVRHISVASPLRHGLRSYTAASAAVSRDGFEMVHVLDARFAPIGAMLRRRLHVPVSVSVTEADLGAGPWSRVAARSLRGLDQAFTSDDAVAQALRASAWRLPLTTVTPCATEVPWPDKRDVSRVARALRGVRPGRLVVGVPWPRNRNDFRWFRDLVQPGLASNPICLLFGVRSRREAKWMLHSTGRQAEYRILAGRVDASTIAAVSRVVDAFAVPSPSGAPATTSLSLALAAAGVPIVSDGAHHEPVFAHEDNAFLSDAADDRAFVSALDRLLALPAVQRHFLGEEFARFTLQRWPWSAAADVYADRFAVLVGRPRIPADLRAA